MLFDETFTTTVFVGIFLSLLNLVILIKFQILPNYFEAIFAKIKNKSLQLKNQYEDKKANAKKSKVIKKDFEFLGLDEFENKSEDEFKREAQEIMQSVNTDGKIRVPFSKAMYILRNYKNYNIFSNEDGAIVFQKLKELADREEKIEKQINKKVIDETSNEEENRNEKKVVSLIGGNKYKIENSLGYYVIEDGKILEAVNYSEELKKNEEKLDGSKNISDRETLQKKIDAIDSKLLNTNQTSKKESSTEKKETKTTKSDNSSTRIKSKKPVKSDFKDKEDDITDSINDLAQKLGTIKKSEKEDSKSNEIVSESNGNAPKKPKESKDKEIIKEEEKSSNLANIANFNLNIEGNENIEKIECDNIVFLIDSLENNKPTKILNFIIEKLLLSENIFNEKENILFSKLDFQKKIYFVDVNLFLVLFISLVDEKEKAENLFLIGKKAFKLENIKKVLDFLNATALKEYSLEVFNYTKKSKSVILQRNFEYENSEIIQSNQMLMINLEFLEKHYEKNIDEIRDIVFSKVTLHETEIKNSKLDKTRVNFEYKNFQ